MTAYRDLPAAPRLFLGTSGHVLGIDTRDGHVIWKAQVHGDQVSLLVHGATIFAGYDGGVTCLEDGASRRTWETPLKLSWPVAMALDPQPSGGLLIVAGAGMVHALEAATGKVLWTNGLDGFGYQPICLRAPGMVQSQPLTRQVRVEIDSIRETVDDGQDRG